jgi:hypothetical protein
MRYTGLRVCAALFAFGATAGAQTPAPTAERERERVVRRVTTADSAALNRATLGVTLSRTGTRRDTLGIFISSVAENGPAERAGVFEGDRIATINGVDVRTAAGDAADPYLAGVAQRRLTMEMRRLTPGQRVSLRVWSGGRYKNVEVVTGRFADVYPNRRLLGFGDITVPMPAIGRGLHITPRIQHRMMLRDGRALLPAPPVPAAPPIPPAPPVPPVPPVPGVPAEPLSFEFSEELELATQALAEVEVFAEDMERAMLEVERAMTEAETSLLEAGRDLLEWEGSLQDFEVELFDLELDEIEVRELTNEALRQAQQTLASLTVISEMRLSAL